MKLVLLALGILAALALAAPEVGVGVLCSLVLLRPLLPILHHLATSAAGTHAPSRAAGRAFAARAH